MFGCTAFDAAPATLVCIALMHMIKTRPLGVEEGNAGRTAARIALLPGRLIPSTDSDHCPFMTP